MNLSGRLNSLVSAFFGENPIERKKIFLLIFSFFATIGGYTVIKELKDTVFISVVGLDYQPKAKLIALVLLIPLVFIYSRLVDVLHRYQVLVFMTAFYSVMGLILAYLLGHPVIGLQNTDASPDRLFGWFFYFFCEGYSPFVLSVLWSFVNSITTPDSVKNGYITFTIASKFGGMATASLAWYFLSLQCAGSTFCSHARMYQFIFTGMAFLLLAVPILTLYLVRVIPHSHMQGYKKAYVHDKQEKEIRRETSSGIWGEICKTLNSMFSGLWVILRYPYVFGIFLMLFFWDIVNSTYNFMRLDVVREASTNVAEIGKDLFAQVFFMHLIGLLIVLLGTKTLVSVIGMRRSLILIPISIGAVIFTYLFSGGALPIWIAFVIMRAFNYAFASPLREGLYIPTTKNTKFKAKSWIDSFGSKLAKAGGSSYVLFSQQLVAAGVVSSFSLSIVFYGLIITAWSVVAALLGKKYERVVENNEVIGVDA
jgi:AAA family ATP:ADP antiporter